MTVDEDDDVPYTNVEFDEIDIDDDIPYTDIEFDLDEDELPYTGDSGPFASLYLMLVMSAGGIVLAGMGIKRRSVGKEC